MEVKRLTPAHAAAYRALMLCGYESEPEAFTATVPEREPLPLEWWIPRVSDDPGADQLVIGAFVADDLVGVAGLQFKQRVRTRHKATLFGMFVLPAFHGQGIGRQLVGAVLDIARSAPETRVVQLTVTQSNTTALRFYESCGFRAFGTEPLANRIGDRFVGKIHMWCPVDPSAAPSIDPSVDPAIQAGIDP